jgi:hypothetical protein
VEPNRKPIGLAFSLHAEIKIYVWPGRDAAERANSGEEPGEGEEGPGLDEAEFPHRFAHLFHDVGAA